MFRAVWYWAVANFVLQQTADCVSEVLVLHTPLFEECSNTLCHNVNEPCWRRLNDVVRGGGRT